MSNSRSGIMDCSQCETSEGVLMHVDYTDGNAEELPLCGDCREEFEHGGFISDLEPVEEHGEFRS
ncbi:hypothetical protein [Halorarum salinum]|uniref:Uncharacterized protein n=1 Tax=Halorarum salinum TaxID=2743089 RepID=A0A7D5QBW5_9EURY|nr:hypothetical protein [Halobaculum salinum]QLG63736.1 hypothetical protein HUG12_19210 [Halobaculum salinum]